MPTAWVDVDGVVLDLGAEWFARYNRDFGDNLDFNDVTGWNFEGVKLKCTPEVLRGYLEASDLYDNVQGIHGAGMGVQALREFGYRVVFCTTATVGHAGQKLKRLQTLGLLPKGRVQDPDYIEVADKTLLAMQPGDIFIDDRYDTVMKIMDCKPGVSVMLFAAPHNRLNHGAMMPCEWPDVISAVANIHHNSRAGAEPNTLSQLDAGAVKLDGEKTRYDLVPADVEHMLAELFTQGAKKYADRNWEKGFRWGRPYAALRRHLYKFWGERETHDAETGIHHLIGVIWNACVLYKMALNYPERDDRSTLKGEVGT